ncbi:MAG: tryptophan-rich sensory protein TspO [Rubricella sp.]
MFEWLVLAGFGVACMAAAATGAMFPPGQWYRDLSKPGWTPPDWLFPLAWTALYIAMTIAAWRLVLSGDPLAPLAAAVWSAQIALNTLWSPVFFGLRRIGAGLVVLVLLWLAVASAVAVAIRIDTTSALLLAPYLVWVSYAGALNLSILRRNPSV